MPYAPPIWSIAPFVALLIVIAVLPLMPAVERFWRHNRNKLAVGIVLSLPVLAFYFWQHPLMEVHHGGELVALPAGLPVLRHVLERAIVDEYFPFIVLLLSLYTITGGIQLRGDLFARPRVNTTFLAAGAMLASLIGTTGAAMLLIRPLIQSNSERKHVRHTMIFFIFIVCNIGGCLLPIGDPPLFLGYLQGVPFLWTLKLAAPWAVCNAILLTVYYFWDRRAFRSEAPADIVRDRTRTEPLNLHGRINLLYLLGVLLSVAVLIPGKPLPGLPGWIVPNHLREGIMLILCGLSWFTTPGGLRKETRFTFHAIGEVAALFLGIFITMQAPIEILQARGQMLGLVEPWQYFWATGGLSSVLDNAPTYVVFFEAANSLTRQPGPGVLTLLNGQYIREDLLSAVSLGAVFMGAMTYIGNGPNFLVKSIAEQHHIKMPTFGGYILYSAAILLPVFVLITLLFLL